MYEIKWQTIVNLSILENASNVYSMWEYKHHRKRFFLKERMLRTGMTLSGNLEFAILWLLILENKFY